MTQQARTFVEMARRAGYSVSAVEQLRANRWLLSMRDATGATIGVLVQKRALLYAADVLDVAEIVRLRGFERGLLWAYGGRFSAAAVQTCQEVGKTDVGLCTMLPPAAAAEGGSTTYPYFTQQVEA